MGEGGWWNGVAHGDTQATTHRCDLAQRADDAVPGGGGGEPPAGRVQQGDEGGVRLLTGALGGGGGGHECSLGFEPGEGQTGPKTEHTRRARRGERNAVKLERKMGVVCVCARRQPQKAWRQRSATQRSRTGSKKGCAVRGPEGARGGSTGAQGPRQHGRKRETRRVRADASRQAAKNGRSKFGPQTTNSRLVFLLAHAIE